MGQTQRRVFYAVESISVASGLGSLSYFPLKGVQSVGIDTKWNLEPVFEIGQISLYNQVENIPDVSVTMEKVLDGYPLIYHWATFPSTSASLVGRSATKCTLGLSVFSDVQNSASGTPIAQTVCSGMFVSTLSYNFVTQGNLTEQVTLVGNNQFWQSGAFTPPTFDNLDAPLASEVQRRQDVLFGSSASLLPTDIPGISSSGTNELGSDGFYLAKISSIKPSVNLGREALYALGQRGTFYRYAQFPVEVKTDIEVHVTGADSVNAVESATTNVTTQAIKIMTKDGTTVDLGTKNKLTSRTWGGGNAQLNGGNVSETYSYLTYNDFTVTHPQDPSGL